MALRPDRDSRSLTPGELLGYSVDAGTGCFTDRATMETLLAEAGIADVEDWRLGPYGHWTPDGHTTQEWKNPIGAVHEWTDAFGDRLFEKLEATEDVWATVTAPNGGNLIAFDSGWGDGGYPSYFGYDAHDHLVCLVTDFYVLQGAT